ncbi:MAG TPA: thiamine pyrophosphate-binding protein [Gaiella sp.]|jgi:acetolactate synthase-1/2/3 large subunit
MRRGGQIVVDQLVAQGVDLVFGVPGESYIAVLDALLDAPIRYVTCRHEVGAANMAEAYGKLTGRPGVCMVTRGPGATHASCGIHTADQDSTPLVLLVGQVPRAMRGRDAFQELDYPSVFGTMTNWTAEAGSADDLAPAVAHAFRASVAGRPGPVVLALPEDVLAEESGAATVVPEEVQREAPGADDLARLRELLAAAERPLVIVGEGGWSASASDDVLAFAEASGLPVAASFRCQDYVDNHAPVYCGPLTLGGDPKLLQRVRDADLVLALGGRLGDITTQGYTLLEAPRPRQALVHVHPDADELGSVYQPALGIASGLPEAAAALRALEPVASRWREWTEAARADYVANLRHRPLPGDLDMGEVMAELRAALPEDAVLASGAGNFTVWAHRFYEFRRYGTQLAPASGAMGYGLPAAIAAKIVHPERIAVCLAGDGDFLMTGQELVTAVQEDAPVVVLVVDNRMLGTIRMHQERHFPGRVSGTDLVSPDFAALARAYGGHGERVERTADFAGALERALASGLPSVLHLIVDPEAITPRHTLSEIRAAAQDGA